MGEIRYAWNNYLGKSVEKKPLETYKLRYEDNIKKDK
jgi:hypothetical protein